TCGATRTPTCRHSGCRAVYTVTVDGDRGPRPSTGARPWSGEATVGVPIQASASCGGSASSWPHAAAVSAERCPAQRPTISASLGACGVILYIDDDAPSDGHDRTAANRLYD